jgi:hypothetical protein
MIRLLTKIIILMLAVPSLAATDARSYALNVSIVVFDPGVPADQALHRDLQVYPRIRQIEALFLPFVLREALVKTNEWGAVRVVPEPDEASELMVTGTIIRSDGDSLELKIVAVDATGRVWLEQSFAGVLTAAYASGDNGPASSGYQELYSEIAASLLAARSRLDDRALQGIVDVSMLRYASELAPSAFAGYLAQSSDGVFTVNRLPAKNDPMLERIERIRSTEYVITDAVDQKFQQLHAEIASVYDLWREHRRKVVKYQAEDAQRVQASTSDEPRGSFYAMKSHYDNYKWEKMMTQEQDRLAVAFNNEVGAKVMAMEARVAELQGWVDQESREWQRILEELFEVETGL